MDFRAAAGTWLVKYFKLGKLNIFGSSEGGIGSIFGKSESYDDEKLIQRYTSHVWAYRGINAIAKTAGSIPLMVVMRDRDGRKKEVVGHRFTELVNNPNEFMTRRDLIELLLIFLESTGDGLWLFDNGDPKGVPLGQSITLKQVKEIWPLPSQWIKPIEGQKAPIIGYKYRPDGAGEGETLAVSEVFHVKYPNPLSMIDGLGSLEPAMGDIAGDMLSQTFKNFVLKNIATNAIFLKTDGALTAEQRETYKRSLASVFRGVRIGFMESGLDFALPQIAPKDLPLLEMDKAAERRILGALDVPPVLAGSQEAKYDNADAQIRVFWQTAMIPRLEKIAGMLTKKLHALGENKNLEVVFDLSGVKELQSDAKIQAETAKVWRDMGVPLNDLIKVFGVSGLEDVEGGDVGLVSSSSMPLTDVAAGPDEPLDPEGTPEDAPEPEKNPKAPKDDEDAEDAEDAEDGSSSEKAMRRGAPSDKALDDAHWKRFMAQNEPGFRRLRAELRRQFKRQETATIDRIVELYKGSSPELVKTAKVRDPLVEVIIFDVNTEAEKFSKAVRPIVKSIYAKLGAQAVADIGVEGISFDIESPLARKFLESHVAKFTFEVNKTTRNNLRDALSSKIAQGGTQAELSAEVARIFDMAKGYRSARIARTETAIAGNAGILDGMKQAGVEKKRWISSRDEKVRDTHKNADGQEVAIGDLFDVGGYLLNAPGDPNGPAEEICNCRCTLRSAR